MIWVVCRNEPRTRNEHGQVNGWAVLVLNEQNAWQPATFRLSGARRFAVEEDAIAVALVVGGYVREDPS